MLAQPDRDRRRAAGRDRQSQFRQSRAARNHGPAGRGRSKASAKPAGRWTSRSFRAMSRSTTRPMAAASCPRPTIGGVGLLPDWTQHGAASALRAADQPILLVGAPDWWGTHLGQSIYLRDLFGRTRRAAAAGRSRAREAGRRPRPQPDPRGIATACTISPMAAWRVGLAEMAMASGIGAESTNSRRRSDPAVFRRGSGPLPGDAEARFPRPIL